MSSAKIAHPPIVSRDAWLEERKQLLQREKALTKELDSVNAQRRRLPMVKVEKSYSFESKKGKRTLVQLFDGRKQLIVYHFMFGPENSEGCPGCTSFIDALGDLSMLAEKDTTFVVISRAPLEKLNEFKNERGWDIQWVSSFNTDFNFDFHVSFDPKVAPVEYNYLSGEEWKAKQNGKELTGEGHALSVFFRVEGDVFHTYQSFARGCESKSDGYSLLDLTPYGRQQAFEVSPEGWPQKPTYGE